MKHLGQENPLGRLDVLAFRIAARIAQSQCPQQWPVLEPFIESWCRRTLGGLTK